MDIIVGKYRLQLVQAKKELARATDIINKLLHDIPLPSEYQREHEPELGRKEVEDTVELLSDLSILMCSPSTLIDNALDIVYKMGNDEFDRAIEKD